MNNHVILVNGTTKNTVPMEIVTIAQNLCQRMIAVRIGKGWSRMNEIEKAIMDLQEYIGSGGYNGNNPPIYLNTANIAISALEKQIAGKIEKDIVIDEDYSGNTYEREIPVCPSCNNIYLMLKQPHCNQCGQKIDWRVEE